MIEIGGNLTLVLGLVGVAGIVAANRINRKESTSHTTERTITPERPTGDEPNSDD